MVDFRYLQNAYGGSWVISAPRRSKRPTLSGEKAYSCPFCPGRESEEKELYRVGGNTGDPHWQIRVLPNKFPFAQVHELIIHTPQHDRDLNTMTQDEVEQLARVYRQRYQTHQDKGQVYLFHNRGQKAGESIPHAHTQLVVIPPEITTAIPSLDLPLPDIVQETAHFSIFCPKTSQWPDEVWVAPKWGGKVFGEISDDELSDFAHTLARLIRIFTLRHGKSFSFNYYLYPKANWYLRLIPREKTLGGFEVGTGVFVNTQDPNETISFITQHFENPDEKKITEEHQAVYHRDV